MNTPSGVSIKSGISQKVLYAKRLVVEKGLGGFFSALINYLRYHLSSKWHFVYLEWKLENPPITFTKQVDILVRQATTDDLTKIRQDFFPHLIDELEYEKRYFDNLDQQNIKCFIAEKDNEFVNYSWVFLSASESPLADTPFDSTKIKPTDVYLGPIFTNPSFRGFIYPYVLATIQQFLVANTSAQRVIVLVQGLNSAAVSFYKRLGFDEISSH